MVGTYINVGTIVVGSAIGAAVGARLPEHIRTTVFHGLGLIIILVGLQMALETKNVLVVLGAILIGGILGEILKLTEGLEWLGARLQSLLPKDRGIGVAEGFITGSLVFCIGPLAILGAIEDALRGDYRLLTIKALLDGFLAIAFAATLGGWGVAFSALSIFVYQGVITLFANILSGALAGPMTTEMTATGGLIVVGIGLKLLDLTQIRLASFLPALVIAPLIVAAIPWFKHLM